MMIGGSIMITETIKVDNVFLDNPIYYPDQFHALKPSGHKISALSIITKRSSGEDFKTAVQECLLKLSPLLSPTARLVGFCATLFAENTVAITRKGLWKSYEQYQRIKDVATECGPEKSIVDGGKIRFYGFSTLELKDALWLLEGIRSCHLCFGILSETLDVRSSEVVDQFYKAAFPDASSLDVQWPSLIQYAARGDTKIVRVTGTHDDREVSIDVFNWARKRGKL